ncbi:HAMP domain-containing histidine kinase [Tianweitania sp. BSSL-BM11]|uniref:histidine kinase n=1 Tax=Tianweitania aestuarii TaxID=2814886 RepID=A0ABS5RQI1_9HYPH|nr:ATP-binding protein [Tianweitania aestuarii]MBS9719303.1 HAMP domain-containing histidine kinase [Tianweitania aestuarii]
MPVTDRQQKLWYQRLRFAWSPTLNHDATNKNNLLLLVQLRWLAVCGQIITILFVGFGLGVDLPLLPMGLILLGLVALNIFSLMRARSQSALTNTELFIQLLLDVATLTAQLYLSGGATNPFISLYLLQVTLGAVLLQPWSSWVLVALTALCFVFLSVFFQPLELPHLEETGLLQLHIQGMFFCFVLTAGLVVLFLIRASSNLRARDARLADLRQQSAEEHHIVRMGLLASGAAHELGTPLATLSVILNDWKHMPLFRQEPELTEEITEMQSQLDRCKSIVSGILMSSGEARGEGVVRTTVTGFFDDLVGEWRASRSPRHLVFQNGFSPDAAIVSDLSLKQVIFNVLDNAHEESPSWMKVATSREGDNLRLIVTDVGKGFSPEMLAEIGRPYRSSKGRPGGGLGLFLVVNVVRKLGGTVSATNRPEGGACVTLDLPLSSLSVEGVGHAH